MSKTQAWVKAFRLRTLPLSLAGIIAGSGVALYNGFWDNLIFSFSLITTILFQVLSNLANDFGDGVKGTDNEDRIGPERPVQSGIISQKEMKVGVIITAVLSLMSAAILIYLGSQKMPMEVIWFYVGLAILCVIAAITYTVGKRAYGYHGMGDIMVLLFFGGVSVLGVYSLYAKSFLMENVTLALGIGLLSAAVLNLNNMRDFENDSKSGKNTIVVKMGPTMAKLYHFAIISIALLCLAQFISQFGQPLLFIALAPALILIIHLRKVMQTQHPKDFDPELKKVALSTFGISLLLFGMFIYLSANG